MTMVGRMQEARNRMSCTCDTAVEVETLRAQLASSLSEQIRLSLALSVMTNERDEARALGRMA